MHPCETTTTDGKGSACARHLIDLTETASLTHHGTGGDAATARQGKATGKWAHSPDTRTDTDTPSLLSSRRFVRGQNMCTDCERGSE